MHFSSNDISIKILFATLKYDLGHYRAICVHVQRNISIQILFVTYTCIEITLTGQLQITTGLHAFGQVQILFTFKSCL